jgi:predicted amidohydrolase YtcJ
MKINTFLVAVFCINCFLSAAQKASMIVHHAKVITLDDSNRTAEAIAVLDGKLLGVGSNAAIMKFKSSKTMIVNANGRTVIPGLYDSHLHVIRAGRFYNTELRWDGVRTLKKAMQMLAEQAARTPAGQWVRVVGGWN